MADASVPPLFLRYKYRLLPSERQHRALEKILEDQRQLYNAALEERIGAWKKAGVSVSLIDQQTSLTVIRRECPGWSDYPAVLQRGTLRRLDRAFRGFFRRHESGGRAGFPRFRGKGRFDSFDFPEFSGLRFDGRRIRFKGMPGGLRVHLHRPLPGGRVLAVSFKRTCAGWHVSFTVSVPPGVAQEGGRAVGIDLGILSLATLSTGEAVPNPRPGRRAEREMRRRKRALARCERGSKRRAKVRARVARLYADIRNRRHTRLHQVAARLTREFDIIAVERLNIAGMARGMLAKDVGDAAWATFKEMLRYKAAKAGARVIEVDCKNTSRECSGCGSIVPKKLSERWHHCLRCGLSLDRDHNAARVILHRAVASPGSPNAGRWAGRATGNLAVKR